MSDLERIEHDIESYLLNLVTVRCRLFEREDGKKALYFSSRLNVARIVKEEVLKTIDTAIEKEIHGENIFLHER